MNQRIRHHRLTLCLLALACTVGAGCQKASEVAAEKMIEAQARQQGVDAKVKISEGGTTITTTDAQGRSVQIAAGVAQITEADIGVPLYPGASIDPNGSRVTTPEGTMVQAVIRSSDTPEKVAAFYRDVLKERSAGRQMMDASQMDGSATLILGDESGRGGVTLHIGRGSEGTEVSVQTITPTLTKP